MHTSFKTSKPPLTWRNIDSLNFFSLAGRPPIPLTPYNPNYYMTTLFLFRPQYIAQANKLLSSPVPMSNKIALTTKRAKPKKSQIFCFFSLKPICPCETEAKFRCLKNPFLSYPNYCIITASNENLEKSFLEI